VKRSRVVSSSVAAVGYDEESRILEVEFVDGRVYRYVDVPPARAGDDGQRIRFRGPVPERSGQGPVSLCEVVSQAGAILTVNHL